jgi:gamma-glutamyltranspeptidase/glutathione hydrolase
LIQSNYYGFGSGMVPGDLGFALQNRGTLFALDPKHPNCLAPGKRPFHTIIPAMVTRDGKPWLTLGMVGGDFQPQGHVQVLVNMIDFGMNVQEAGDAPRMDHLGSATPKGQPAQGGGTVGCESGIEESTLQELEHRGHKIERNYKNGGAYEGIEIGSDGVLRGASESRRDGRAIGY